MKKLLNIFKNQKGASAVEYGVMLSLIAAAIIGTVYTMGTRINSTLLYVLNGVNQLPPR